MKRDILRTIEENMDGFSKGQRQIARYLLAHYDKAAYMTAAKLGAEVSVSESTVVRFVMELGYAGYPEFQKALQELIRTKLTSFQRMVCRHLTPKVGGWVAAHGQISFYIWLMSLIVIIGRTTCFIIDHSEADRRIELLLAVVALVICAMQFIVGRRIGRKYGDASAGGQSLGQKNTVMAVWMAQSFLDPLSSVAPTAYIVWQNLVNSYQLYRFGNNVSEKERSK